MAVGDVVSQISSTGTVLTYQPAAGVEVMVTSCFMQSNPDIKLTDGVNSSEKITAKTGFKIFLNNSIYMKIDAATGKSAFTGIQIK